MGLMAIILFRMRLDAGYLGLLMVMMAIPTLIFGPIAGTYVDRWNRKHTMMMADILRGLIVLSLIFYAQLWYIYASIFMLATVSRFFYPAQSAIIPDIVEKDILLSANSFSQTTYMLSAILGPAIGAALVGIFGIDSVFLFDGLSFFISAFFIFLMRYSGAIKGMKDRKKSERNLWKETADGIRFSMKNPVVRTIMIFVFVLVLFFGGFDPLFMIFIRDILNMGLFNLGILMSMQGISSLLASLVIGIVGAAFSKKNMVLGASLTIGSTASVLVLFPYPFVAFQAMAFFGIGTVFFSTPLTTLLQEAVPDTIRGRVFGTFGAIMQIASLSSMAVESIAADLFGVREVMFTVGFSVVVFSAAFFSKKKNREMFT